MICTSLCHYYLHPFATLKREYKIVEKQMIKAIALGVATYIFLPRENHSGNHILPTNVIALATTVSC